MQGHVFGGHAKRKCLNLNGLLSALEGLTHYRVDLSHACIGQGETPCGGTCPMHHEGVAGIAKRLFQSVWIAEIEGKVVLRVRIQHAGINMIETFWSLSITFPFLRP